MVTLIHDAICHAAIKDERKKTEGHNNKAFFKKTLVRLDRHSEYLLAHNGKTACLLGNRMSSELFFSLWGTKSINLEHAACCVAPSGEGSRSPWDSRLNDGGRVQLLSYSHSIINKEIIVMLKQAVAPLCRLHLTRQTKACRTLTS